MCVMAATEYSLTGVLVDKILVELEWWGGGNNTQSQTDSVYTAGPCGC